MSVVDKNHMKILKDMCRLCNESINQRKRYHKINFAEEIFVLMRIDVKNETEQVHPQFLCNNCSRNLYRYRDTKDIHSDLNLSPKTFVPHSEECEICELRKIPNRGRPKKRKTRDALFDPSSRTTLLPDKNDVNFAHHTIVPDAKSQNESDWTDANAPKNLENLSLIPEETWLTPSSSKSPDLLITATGQTLNPSNDTNFSNQSYISDMSDDVSQEVSLWSSLKTFELPVSNLPTEQITSCGLIGADNLSLIGSVNDDKITTNDNYVFQNSQEIATEMKDHFDQSTFESKDQYDAEPFDSYLIDLAEAGEQEFGSNIFDAENISPHIDADSLMEELKVLILNTPNSQIESLLFKLLDIMPPETMNLLCNCIGRKQKKNISADAESFSLLYKDMIAMSNFSVIKWLTFRDKSVLSYLLGILGNEISESVPIDLERLFSSDLLSVSRALEQLYALSNKKLISPVSFLMSISAYAFTGSKVVVDMIDNTNPSGHYKTIANWLKYQGSQLPVIPACDLMNVFDNEQVIGKTYSIKPHNKVAISVITNKGYVKLLMKEKYSM
ncbi:unnamed protein product [Mytilus edulis]|uniref:RAG1 importin-binding domain-containing protein n=1 Tax=Mytilus edulis TaxID=6550 RepID=A0A8S3TXP7_MYTED|nr:unnamed protein product [Mytilus edulis]